MKKFLRSLALVTAVGGVALAPLHDADAALNAYLNLKGQKQGQIKGSVVQKGREDSIAVIAVSHEIVSPRDASSGLPTGKRQHKPLVITKELDRSSPLLYNALANNENLPAWSMTIYGATKTVSAAPLYTIKLTNASVASIRTTTADDGKVIEEVSFAYQKIEWLWHTGSIAATDEWAATR